MGEECENVGMWNLGEGKTMKKNGVVVLVKISNQKSRNEQNTTII